MKKRHNGVVVRASSAKTSRVDLQRVYRHARYGKILRKTVSCHVHDEHGKCKIGDFVEIVESRPMSRLKRWSLVSIAEQ